MTFKVGDKVRLTGDLWGDSFPAPGTEVVVTQLDSDGLAWFEGPDGRDLYIDSDGFEAELVNDASDALDNLEAADIKAEHIERLEQIVRDAKDKALNRWRSKKHPDYTVEEIEYAVGNVLRVRRDGEAGVTSVARSAEGRPFHVAPVPWEVVREYRGDTDLPTEPGLYVPANNKDFLDGTYVFKLTAPSLEWILYAGDEAETGIKALEGAIHAHTYNGGLVRLGVVE